MAGAIMHYVNQTTNRQSKRWQLCDCEQHRCDKCTHAQQTTQLAHTSTV